MSFAASAAPGLLIWCFCAALGMVGYRANLRFGNRRMAYAQLVVAVGGTVAIVSLYVFLALLP